VARIQLPNGDGHGSRRREFYGRTAAEAERRRDVAAALVSGGADPFTPLADVTDRWLTACEPPNPTHRAPNGLAIATWVGYETHVRRHIVPYMGGFPVAQLTVDDVDRWQQQLRRQGMSASMLGKVLQTLRTILGWATPRGYVQRNVASDQPMSAGERVRWRPLDLDEMQRIIDAIDGHPLRAHFLLALVMGPRMGEINGLGLDDFDRERQTLTINHTLTWKTGQSGFWHRREAKTPRSHRTIYLPGVVVEAFERHLDQRAAWASSAGWQELGLLFTRKNGRPLRGDGTGGGGDQFKRCLKRAGLPIRNFHQLRHHAATTLLALNGNNYHEVALILGHSTFRLTLDLYGHLIPQLERELAMEVDAFYRGRMRSAGSGSSGRTEVDPAFGLADDAQPPDALQQIG
jgi:integrase